LQTVLYIFYAILQTILYILEGKMKEMVELLLGFALGALALTDTGRDVGNKIGTFAAGLAKNGMDYAKSSKQFTGTSGDDHHCG
jgi:hypothetical protein